MSDGLTRLLLVLLPFGVAVWALAIVGLLYLLGVLS